ncbi:hypothetical protein HDF26_002291 [Pedobacter cryoconitis]|uniref:hypothetical protein n=1 Tax=Pedobacter cryoconitis TaxID=188932 RepID=UPI0016180141|nr:hypothetical protein [Pedobacter cryoconitis]MBB6271834.1 hypothetical protein [Pedobacter cryoconitis]
MNALEHLNPRQKGHLLHSLFPREIQPMLNFIAGVCMDILENRNEHEQNWNDDFINFKWWAEMAEETGKIIYSQKAMLIESGYIFSEQLFAPAQLDFVSNQVIRYADVHAKNEKFKLAVAMLWQ